MSSGEGAVRRRGLVADWNDERGFGFIQPRSGGPNVFVHVSAFARGRRPSVGSEVTYAELRDQRGRPQAGAVHFVAPDRRTLQRGRGTPRAAIVTASFFSLLVVLVALDRMPATLLVAISLLSVVTFLAYGRDKVAAEKRGARTSESTLHLLALVGGWPGALVARHFFRHKTRKQPFRTVFWMTVLVSCAALTWFLHETPVTLP